MESYGVSQQTDEGYSEDPLNTGSDNAALALPYKIRSSESASNPLSNASSTELKGWMSTHIANLPTELRARAYSSLNLCPRFHSLAHGEHASLVLHLSLLYVYKSFRVTESFFPNVKELGIMLKYYLVCRIDS